MQLDQVTQHLITGLVRLVRSTLCQFLHLDCGSGRRSRPGEHGLGADWEHLRALNAPERSSKDLNGPRRPAGILFPQVSAVSAL